jgi:hypothetical protein
MTPTQQVEKAIDEHGRPNWVAYVPQRVRQQVPTETLVYLLANAKWSTQTLEKADKQGKMENWCMENRFAEVTIEELMEDSGLSSVSVRNFIKDRPNLFRKLRRGVWEVRDPDADKEADKRTL